MNEEDLLRLKETIDQYEAATGEKSPLRAVLEANTAPPITYSPEGRPQITVTPIGTPQGRRGQTGETEPSSPIQLPPVDVGVEQPEQAGEAAAAPTTTTPVPVEPPPQAPPPEAVAAPEQVIAPEAPRQEPLPAAEALRALLTPSSAAAAESPGQFAGKMAKPPPAPRAPDETYDQFVKRMDDYDKEMAALTPQAAPAPQATPRPTPPEPQKPFDPIDFVASATEPVRQLIGGALGGVAQFPWQMAAGLQAGRELIQRYRFGEESEGAKAAELERQWLESQGAGAKASIKKLIFAAPEPRTMVEKASELVGENLIPVKRYGVPLTMASVAMNAAVKAQQPTSPPMSKELADLLLGPDQPAMPIRGTGEKKATFDKRVEAYNAAIAGSPLKRPAKPKQRKKESPEEFSRRVAVYQAAEANWMKQLTPTARTLIQTVGDSRRVKDSDLWAAGILGFLSAGAIALPGVHSAWRNTRVPRPVTPREVAIIGRNDIVTVSNPLDFIHATTHNVNRTLVAVARRAGMDPVKAQRLSDILGMQTKAHGQAKVNVAINRGRMEGNTLRFQAPTSLPRLNKLINETPNAKEYLIIRDVAEELNIRSQMAKHMPNATVRELEEALGYALPEAEITAWGKGGEPVVQGLTMDDALRMQTSYERANPELIKIGNEWTAWNKALYKFEADGAAGTRMKKGDDPKSLAYMNGQRPNMVPWSGKRNKDMSFQDRVTHTDIVDAQNKRSRAALIGRMNNEAKLYFVDEMRELNQNFFGKITQEELSGRPDWEPFVTRVVRRGTAEMYLADPFIVDQMKLDIPSIAGGQIGQYLYGMKRLYESNYTGILNPAFSIRQALRVWHSAKGVMNNEKLETASILRLAKSVPQQLYPQIGEYIVNSMNANTAGRFAQYLPLKVRQDIARRLAPIIDESLYMQIEHAGGAQGSTLAQAQRAAKIEQQLADAETKIMKVAGPAGFAMRRLWYMYKPFVTAIYESPVVSFVDKNYGRLPMQELLKEGANLGGDPKVTGQYYYVDPRTKQQYPLRFESNSRLQQSIMYAARPLGVAAEIGRTISPWTNAIAQSVKREAVAYLEDPGKYVAKKWLYTMYPAALQYLWNHSLGTDPNGVRYADHEMNGRSMYDFLTKWYLGIPGRPVQDGVNISAVALEAAAFKGLMEVAMDHAMGTNKLDLRTDAQHVLEGSFDISLGIPITPIFSAWEIAHGRVPPMNLLSGEGYKPKTDPFDQMIGMPESIERYMRMVGGGGGNAIAAFTAAYAHTDEGFFKALHNGATEAAKTQIAGIPVLSDEVGVKAKISARNKITEEFYSQMQDINKLMDYHNRLELKGGIVKTKPRSIQGGGVTSALQGPALPEEIPGINKVELHPPTNPIYIALINDMYNRFKKDNPGYDSKGNDVGGVAFLSMMNRASVASRALHTLDSVDAGSHPQWQAQLAQRPDTIARMKEQNVDTTNKLQVQNFYERQRQEAVTNLYFYVRAVLNEFSNSPANTLGRPLTLKDFDPYGSGFKSYKSESGSTEAPYAFPETLTPMQ